MWVDSCRVAENAFNIHMYEKLQHIYVYTYFTSVWMSQGPCMNESFHTYDWVTSHTYEWVMSHTHEWALSHMCYSHVTHIWMSHITHTWISHITHIWMSHITHIWMSHVTHIWVSHVSSVNASCLTYDCVIGWTHVDRVPQNIERKSYRLDQYDSK